MYSVPCRFRVLIRPCIAVPLWPTPRSSTPSTLACQRATDTGLLLHGRSSSGNKDMARPAVSTAAGSSSLPTSSSTSSSTAISHAGIAGDAAVGRKKGGGGVAAAAAAPAAGAPEEMGDPGTATTTSKTLSQLRQDAIRTRKDALSAILPARGARLAELFHLLQGRSDPARFGAGLHPPARTGPSGDPAKPLVLIQDIELDRNLAEFTERWIRNPKWVLARRSRRAHSPRPPSLGGCPYRHVFTVSMD